MSTLVPNRVKETPASARLVYTALNVNGPLEKEALIDETGIARRTINSALAELRDRGLVEAREHPADHRRRLYAAADQ